MEFRNSKLEIGTLRYEIDLKDVENGGTRGIRWARSASRVSSNAKKIVRAVQSSSTMYGGTRHDGAS